MAEELLGGGLDIDGWSYLKNEVQGKQEMKGGVPMVNGERLPILYPSGESD